MMHINKNPEYFLTIASERSISKAAEKLFVSQPYLSQHLIRLEKAFNVRLFARDKTPLELTEAGELYANYLENSRQQYQKLMLDFDAISARKAQTIRLGVSNWRATTLLPDILPAFSEQYPEIHLEFYEVPTNTMYQLLLEDKVDCAMMNTPPEIPDQLTMETIFHERICLVGHLDNPAARELQRQKESGQMPDLHLLETQRMILLRPELMMARKINNFLDKKQVVLKNFIYTTNAQTALHLTARNYGFCFLNETGLHTAPNPEKLVWFPFDSIDMLQPLCVLYKKKSYLLPGARRFIDVITDFYRNNYS